MTKKLLKNLNSILVITLMLFIFTGCTEKNNESRELIPTPADSIGTEVKKNNSTSTSKPTNPNTNNNTETPNTNKQDELHTPINTTKIQAIIKTSLGDITIEFYPESPKTVANFIKLANEDFYNKTLFHRVIKDFMIQGGDPNTKTANKMTYGQGGPGYKFNDEFNDHKLVRGSLAMANSGPNTNGSQFFIVTKESTPWLDGMHTNFGYVVSGMDIVDKIEAVEVTPSRPHPGNLPLEPITINSIEIINQK